MKYSKLGRTGLEVSRCCLGTMTWGEQNSEAEGHEQMDYALGRGVNFWDTAELYAVPPRAETYGRTEEIIGTWFEKTGKRQDVILATKVSGIGRPYIREGSPLTGDAVREAVEGSLKRLKTDYIDLYQLHWPNRPFPHFGNNHAGMIDFTANDTARIEDNLLDIQRGIESIQNEFSLLDRSDDPYVAEVCVRDEVAYLPWSPLAMGILSGKYLNKPWDKNWRYQVAKDINSDPGSYRFTEQSEAAVKAYMDVAAKHDLDVCQMAIKFCDVQNFVTSTIIGATSMEQLKIDIDAFDIELSDDAMADIDAVYRQYPLPY